MANTVPETVRCRECSAKMWVLGQKHCWLCHALLEAPARAGLRAPPTVQRQAGWTFGLSTLMVTVALCAVFFGVFRESHALGILLAIVVTPALVRTWVASSREEEKGHPMTGGDWWWAFAESFGGIAATGIAAAFAFLAICFVGSYFGSGFFSGGWFDPAVKALVYIGLPLCIIPATFVGYRLTRFVSMADDWTTNHKIVVAVLWFILAVISSLILASLGLH